MEDLICISQELKYDIKEYYSLAVEYFNLFKGITPLVEDESVTQRVAIDILKDLRLCRGRIQRDCLKFEKYLNVTFIDEFVIDEVNSNLLDLAQTCEQLLQRYEDFEYRDNLQLKQELQAFVEDLKHLDSLIYQYNSKYLQNIIIPSLQFDKLNQIVNLGFDVVAPLQKIPFEEYFRDKNIGNNFRNWLLQNNFFEEKRFKRDWRQLYYKYLKEKQK